MLLIGGLSVAAPSTAAAFVAVKGGVEAAFSVSVNQTYIYYNYAYVWAFACNLNGSTINIQNSTFNTPLNAEGNFSAKNTTFSCSINHIVTQPLANPKEDEADFALTEKCSAKAVNVQGQKIIISNSSLESLTVTPVSQNSEGGYLSPVVVLSGATITQGISFDKAPGFVFVCDGNFDASLVTNGSIVTVKDLAKLSKV